MKDALQFRSLWVDVYFQMPLFNAEHEGCFSFIGKLTYSLLSPEQNLLILMKLLSRLRVATEMLTFEYVSLPGNHLDKF